MGAQRRAKKVGEFADHPVACVVAVLVVDALEMVDIEQQHRETAVEP